jgi:hypothetical protein
MIDIVERLDACSPLTIPLAHEARDEIVRLRKHIALDEIGNKAVQDLWAIDREDLAKAEAERDRLRDALTTAQEFIRDMVDPEHRCEQLMTNPPKCIRSYAAKRFIQKIDTALKGDTP